MRITQALLIVSAVLLAWLLMEAVHELGHVTAAWATGGTVQRVILHPLAISRTDVEPTGTYPVVLTISDPYGNTGSTSFTLVISTLPADRVVPLAGLVNRNPTLNQNLGGVFNLTPVFASGLPTGAYTGALTLGATRYTITGRLAAGGPDSPLTLALSATSKGRPTLALSLTTSNDGTATGLLTPPAGTGAALSAWPTPYSSKNLATAFVGKHTFALFPAGDPAPAAPAGTGFGTLAITVAGKAAWTARLADGLLLTGSAPLARDGQVPVFGRITKPGGSLLGPLSLSAADRSLDGTLTWLRAPAPAATRATTPLYRDGFGPLALTALGGPLSPPPAGTRVLGLPATSPNARLAFLGAGLTEPQLTQLALPPLTVNANNTVTRPTTVAANPAALALALKPAAGTFSGTFVLKDPNPLKPGATITRKVAYQGVLLDGRGVGYFLLPGLKTSATETPATLSGSVLLEPAPTAE